MHAHDGRRFAGLILAGGEGRRWGGPKAWAELPDGRTFLEACARAMCSAGASPIVATLPPGSDDPGVEGVQALPLVRSGLDMFASIRCGLELLQEDPSWQVVVVLPVDHPLVDGGTIATVAAAARPAAIATLNGRHGHPVALTREVAERILAGEQGPTLREVLREAGAVDAVVDDGGVRANCNTPEALAVALVELGV